MEVYSDGKQEAIGGLMNEHVSGAFGTRGGTFIPYPGIRQVGDTCVFANVGGAVNYLSGRKVWTLETLRQAWIGTQPTFTNVANVAVCPVTELLDYFEHLDESRMEPISSFLQDLRKHIDRRGIVIVSLELAVSHAQSEMERKGRYHMLTLVARQGDLYQVWDSNGIEAFVTEQQLTHLDYPDGTLYIEHDRHNALFLFRKPRS
jgi:hypothetical protein